MVEDPAGLQAETQSSEAGRKKAGLAVDGTAAVRVMRVTLLRSAQIPKSILLLIERERKVETSLDRSYERTHVALQASRTDSTGSVKR